MRDRVRYRGLWYRRDVPIDRFEGSGVLAVTTEVDGVRLAAGTPVARDVDLGYVVARLAVPQQVYGVVLPAGTSLHLHRAHPRSRAHWVGTVLIAPLHLLILALLALCWMGATWVAYLQIRRGNVDVHRAWMVRSYALTLAAVTLRIEIPLFLLSGVSFEEAYPVIAWLCWVPNILVAEWLIIARPRFSH